MKKRIIIIGFISIISIAFLVFKLKYETFIEINNEIGVDFSSCKIIKRYYSGGFGDHEYVYVINCSSNFKKIEKKISNWNNCPMNESLIRELYGADRKPYSSLKPSGRYNIPFIDNCFYELYPDLDAELDDFPKDYILALYDKNKHTFYYIDRYT